MMGRLAVVCAALLLAAGCASPRLADGPRPPQGLGPAGTDFGYWVRDAEGAVDSSFRMHIMSRWDIGQEAEARRVFETDGFDCQDGNRPDGRPVPNLECTRAYHLNDDVHAWTVEFWPNDREPRARYTRTHMRNPLINHDSADRK